LVSTNHWLQADGPLFAPVARERAPDCGVVLSRE
jgi:hypothetical protein